MWNGRSSLQLSVRRRLELQHRRGEESGGLEVCPRGIEVLSQSSSGLAPAHAFWRLPVPLWLSFLPFFSPSFSSSPHMLWTRR